MLELGSTLMRVELWDMLNARPGMERIIFAWSADQPGVTGDYDTSDRRVSLNINSPIVKEFAESPGRLVDLAIAIVEGRERCFVR